MTDEELDNLIWQASHGEQVPAQLALLEIAARLLDGRRLSKKCAVALAQVLKVQAESGKAPAQFLFPNKKRKGRPTSVGMLTRWCEAMTLAKVRQEGFVDSSPAREEASGKNSSFREAAERLGFRGHKAKKAAERMRQRVRKAKESDIVGRLIPELNAVTPKKR